MPADAELLMKGSNQRCMLSFPHLPLPPSFPPLPSTLPPSLPLSLSFIFAPISIPSYLPPPFSSLRVLAEVNTLPEDVEPPQWKRLFHSLVPVTLKCSEVGTGSLSPSRVQGCRATSTFSSYDILCSTGNPDFTAHTMAMPCTSC